MRTIKALTCAAVLAAGITASLAQNVYSLNVVGYYNVTVPASTYLCIANQLNTTNNAIKYLIPAPPAGSAFLKWDGGWSGASFDDVDGWLPNGDFKLDPGEAALYGGANSAQTLTFVGEVLQGTLVNPLSKTAYKARASIVPQAGKVSTDLGWVAEPGDTVLKWSGGWGGGSFDDVDGWLPSEPSFGVGEGGLVIKGGASTITAWTRNFTVN